MIITPIAHISSPYKQKFAIPRQPGLVKGGIGEIVFEKAFADPNCVREIEQFSHLWLLFQFHETVDKGWTPTVQPPRLGGKEKVGVFASRSTFRPNGIGLSVVENLGVVKKGASVALKVGGIDLLDGTPIIDIKPYLPYADIIADAHAGYADDVPGHNYTVHFSDDAQVGLRKVKAQYPELKSLITDILQQDPRPAWRNQEIDSKQYGMHLYDLNIKWCLTGNTIEVRAIEKVRV